MPPEGLATQVAVYALTPRGSELGLLLAQELGASLHVPERLLQHRGIPEAQGFSSLPELVASQFHARKAHIFITAAGVAVRMVSPHLRGKDKDPAVIVLDQDGRFSVSLLSGHLGGANRLAEKVAAITKGRAVVTTATDASGTAAVDVLAMDAGLAIEDVSRVKTVNASLAAGAPPLLWDPEGWLDKAAAAGHFLPASSSDQADVLVAWREPHKSVHGLRLIPPALCLGIGCRKGASGSVIVERVRGVFQEQGLSLASLWAMGTVQAKEKEAGLREAASVLGVPLRFFPPLVLDAVNVPNPSQRAAAAVGTASVSEAAALLLAGSRELFMEKQKFGDVTVALALRRPA